MKPKRERRKCINAWNRESERRARENGQHMVTVRMGPVAHARLMDLCHLHQCTVRDVIEGFLFGNLSTAVMQAATEHGMSMEEAVLFIRQGERNHVREAI